MVHDLDVYVATSMRRREDFRKMATTCQQIFHDDRVKGLELRYFDPTLSAAAGHEDKGLIECLMVKCAKALFTVLATGTATAKMPRRRWLLALVNQLLRS